MNPLKINIHPENDVLKGMDEETVPPINESIVIDLDASIHDIDEHYQQQDNLQCL